ncbi:alpha/beta fold hydrolase [Microbacterium arabinogalactanolyticum]|uniref:Haloalkane dehalogenase n=1 Tax=Microbacterium arabinogalactanolyticum TaxID=69365 RepID=A0ABQ5NEZ6_9MICO|nr:alpha/beta hydrolase [Microbacterium arabinogalactanolyticum]GLC84218.1 haloalkane dehalogenase [Microbacterium arabinogalactanolyticum]
MMAPRVLAEGRASTLRVGDLLFRALSWGPEDGIPLLALHGFPQHAASWARVAPLLAEQGIRTLAFDQRGYSPGARVPLDQYTLDAVVGDVIGIADALGCDRLHLAGFGQGALQSWATAAAHPDRIASLTALRFPHPAAFARGVRTDAEQRRAWDALESMSPPRPAAEQLLRDDAAALRSFLAGSGMRQELVDETTERLRDPEALAAAVAWHLIPVEEMAQVPPVTVPALYIFSEGPALLPATAELCAEYAHGGYRMVAFEQGGHWLLDTEAERVAEQIGRHVLDVADGGASA